MDFYIYSSQLVFPTTQSAFTLPGHPSIVLQLILYRVAWLGPIPAWRNHQYHCCTTACWLIWGSVSFLKTFLYVTVGAATKPPTFPETLTLPLSHGPLPVLLTMVVEVELNGLHQVALYMYYSQKFCIPGINDSLYLKNRLPHAVNILTLWDQENI